jgi:hypothetical protein
MIEFVWCRISMEYFSRILKESNLKEYPGETLKMFCDKNGKAILKMELKTDDWAFYKRKQGISDSMPAGTTPEAI